MRARPYSRGQRAATGDNASFPVAPCRALGDKFAARDSSPRPELSMLFDLIKAIVLGVVEGLTEFLPVSSTGHLLLFEHFFGGELDKKAFWDSFAVLIQFGAILALLSIYFTRLWKIALGMFTN